MDRLPAPAYATYQHTPWPAPPALPSPTPCPPTTFFTGPQVSDISEVVRQRADALMLSGESAAGRYPTKALEVLRTVAARMEEWVRTERRAAIALPQIAPTGDGRASEELCNAAALLVRQLCSLVLRAPVSLAACVGHHLGSPLSQMAGQAGAGPWVADVWLACGWFLWRATAAYPHPAPTSCLVPNLHGSLQANNLGVRAIFVFTRRGYMANWLARCRPDAPIFAFTGGCLGGGLHPVKTPASCAYGGLLMYANAQFARLLASLSACLPRPKDNGSACPCICPPARPSVQTLRRRGSASTCAGA